MMKRVLLVFVALALLCGALTGCKTEAPEESATAGEVVQKVPSEVEVTVKDTPQKVDGNKEKDTLMVHKTYPVIEKEDVLRDAKLLFLGTVTASDGGVMTNPDKTVKDENGHIIPNQQIVTYTVKVEKVFKGEYKEETMTLLLTNGYGMSPDLILYGEDETTIFADWDTEILYLEVGKPAIFSVCYNEKTNLLPAGYYLNGKRTGYYPKNEDGQYTSIWWRPAITLDPDTLKEELNG